MTAPDVRTLVRELIEQAPDKDAAIATLARIIKEASK